MRMNRLVLALGIAIAACGGKQQPAGGGRGSAVGNDEHSGVVADTRSPLEKRLDAACKALGPKLTQCAVEDAKAQLAAGKTTQKEFDATTTPEIQAALTKDWFEKCYRPDRSSRQVRILEVCFKEETECAPLLDCLENLSKPAAD